MRGVRLLKKFDNLFLSSPVRALLIPLPGIVLYLLLSWLSFRLGFILYDPLTEWRDLLSLWLFAAVIGGISGSASFTALTILLLAAYNYLKFLIFRDGIILTDIINIDELFQVAPPLDLAAMIASLALLAIAFLLLFRKRRPVRRIIVVALHAGVVALFIARPDLWRQNLRFTDNYFFYKGAEFRFYGLYFSLLNSAVEYADRQRRIASVAPMKAPPGFDYRSKTRPLRPDGRDLYVVLLESFVHPADMTAFTFTPDPVDPLFRLVTAGRKRPEIVSPVTSGGTAMAEFEFLCGVPELAAFSASSFNAMDGGKAECLPRLLQRAGYGTMAASPVKASFYNARRAYRAAGFGQTYFAENFDMTDMDGDFLNNGATLEQTMRRVREQIAREPARPLFSYTVVTSGHWPYDLDEAKRPRIIRESPQNPLARKIVNLSYYTMKAVARMRREIDALGRDYLLIVFADHTPPVTLEELTALGYRGADPAIPISTHAVFARAFDKNGPIPLPRLTHYELSQWAADRLSRRDCADETCLYGKKRFIHRRGIFDRANPGKPLCAPPRLRRSYAARDADLVLGRDAPVSDTAQCDEDRKRAEALKALYLEIIRQAQPGGRAEW